MTNQFSASVLKSFERQRDFALVAPSVLPISRDRQPFHSTSRSVKAYRNILYLQSKEVLAKSEPSKRMATEITNDNIRRQQRIDNRRWFVAAMQA